jgi:hypothetical protein
MQLSVKPLSMALLAMTSLSLPTLSSAQIEIPEGTKVRVRLDQQLSSETAREGESVELSVANDIKVGSVVVIKEGTVVTGKVLSAVPTRNLGRAGRLDFSIDAIVPSDGRKIPLRYSLEKNKGGSSKGAGVLTFAVAGVVGLLSLEGHDTVLYEGTAYDVFTDGIYTLKTDAPSNINAEPTSATVQGSTLPLDAPSIAVVYFLDSRNQTLTPLSDEPWTSRKYGDSGIIEVSGERSTVRIVQDRPAFVFKIGNPENAKLYALTVDTKNKKLTGRWFSLLHAFGKSRQVSPGMPVEITKFGQSSFALVPKQPLRPGEYAVLLSGSKVFTFGIDQ